MERTSDRCRSVVLLCVAASAFACSPPSSGEDVVVPQETSMGGGDAENEAAVPVDAGDDVAVAETGVDADNDAPPGTEAGPTDAGDDAATTTATCATFCTRLGAAGCSDGMDPTECTADCEQDQRTIPRRCVAQHDAYLACVSAAMPTCMDGYPVVSSCTAAEDRYAECTATEENPPPPDPGEMRATWTELGPGACTGSPLVRVSSPLSNVLGGAVNVVLPHPTDASVLYVGAVNGGVWRSRNANTSAPDWTPLLDQAASLSIGALAFDVADSTGRTLIAGFGRTSSFAGRGGRLNGITVSRDGGDSWTPLPDRLLVGANIVSVAMNGNTILAGSSGIDPRTEEGEDEPDENLSPAIPALFRSTNGGSTFARVRTLPRGSVRRLLVDPREPRRVYLALLGANAGIYRSGDFGGTWTKIDAAPLTMDARTGNVQLSIHATATSTALWVATTRSLTMTDTRSRANGVFRAMDAHTSTGEATWTSLAVPSTVEPMSSERDTGLGGDRVSLNPGNQGNSHLSLAADPTNANIVYVGGDRVMAPPNRTSFGSVGYTGRLLRGDLSLMGDEQWTVLTDDFADPDGDGMMPGTSPHADHRVMAFGPDGTLLEGSDGGMYRRSNPRENTGVWSSFITPTFGAIEAHDAAWDNNFNVAITGNQDNGVCLQNAMGARQYTALAGGDGGDVSVDDLQPGTSVYYYSSQTLGGFRRDVRDAEGRRTQAIGLQLGTTGMRLTEVDTSRPFVTPVALNQVVSDRLLIVTYQAVYESMNRGDNVTRLTIDGAARIPAGGYPCRPVYGGRRGGMDNPDVIFAGGGPRSPSVMRPSRGWLYRRTAAGDPLEAAPGYMGSSVDGVTVDPNDWQRVFVVDDVGRVWMSANAGDTFMDITGSLDAREVRGIAYVPAMDSTYGLLVIGGMDGVYGMRTDRPGMWRQFGFGLPAARVFDIRYHAGADSLIIGTLGRGAWRLTEARRAAREFM